MMKRRHMIAAVLAALLAASVTGCGGSSAQQSSSNDLIDTTATDSLSDPSEITPEIVQESDDLTEYETESSIESIEGGNTGDEISFSKEGTIEETVLYDADDVKITAKELTYGNYDAELKLVIENDSDSDISVIAGSLGYSCNAVNQINVEDGYVNSDVAAGKKASEEASFSYEALMLYGISEIADMELGFQIDFGDENTIYTGPLQVKTSLAESHDYSEDNFKEYLCSSSLQSSLGYVVDFYGDRSLYDVNGLSLLSEALLTNSAGRQSLVLEYVNNTENSFEVTTSDIQVNGLQVVSGCYSTTYIASGHRAFESLDMTMLIDKEFAKVYGIDTIRNISVTVGTRADAWSDPENEENVDIVITEGGPAYDASGTEVYNSNGVRIVFKGFYEDPSDYSNDIHALFLAENNSGQEITIDDEYDSCSVNDMMVDFPFLMTTAVASDGASVLDLDLSESDMEDAGISGPDDIENAEISLEIRDINYAAIDTAKIVLAN